MAPAAVPRFIPRYCGLSWCTAMPLACSPALRDTQPGIPPLGGLSDYASYLWAEYTVAASTIIAIWIWISRHRSKIAAPVPVPTPAAVHPGKPALPG